MVKGMLMRGFAAAVTIGSLYLTHLANSPKNSTEPAIILNIGSYRPPGEEEKPFEGIYMTFGERGLVVSNVSQTPVVLASIAALSVNGDPILTDMKISSNPQIEASADEFVYHVNSVVNSQNYAFALIQNNPNPDQAIRNQIDEALKNHVDARVVMAEYFYRMGDKIAAFGLYSEVLASHAPNNAGYHLRRIQIAEELMVEGNPRFTAEYIQFLRNLLQQI